MSRPSSPALVRTYVRNGAIVLLCFYLGRVTVFLPFYLARPSFF